MEIKIDNRLIGPGHPTYFIADIAANHDGDLDRALLLIRLAKEAGADAAKFQNFQAAKIVSDYGFSHMNSQVSHQATWKKSVFQVYKEASVPFDWPPVLKVECNKIGIEFLTSPYDYEAIEAVDPYLPAFKIGSGEIDWIETLQYQLYCQS
jgi:sialic acid synthase SpsE